MKFYKFLCPLTLAMSVSALSDDLKKASDSINAEIASEKSAWIETKTLVAAVGKDLMTGETYTAKAYVLGFSYPLTDTLAGYSRSLSMTNGHTISVNGRDVVKVSAASGERLTPAFTQFRSAAKYLYSYESTAEARKDLSKVFLIHMYMASEGGQPVGYHFTVNGQEVLSLSYAEASKLFDQRCDEPGKVSFVRDYNNTVNSRTGLSDPILAYVTEEKNSNDLPTGDYLLTLKFQCAQKDSANTKRPLQVTVFNKEFKVKPLDI